MNLQTFPSPDAAAAWLATRLGRGATLASDSRRVRAGDGFVAWPGARHDGRRFVGEVLARGAAACLVEAHGAEAFGLADARVGALAALERQAGAVAHRFFGAPSERLDVVAVTGTNGKTSSSWWIAQALRALGRRCGVVGTLGIGEPGALDDTGLTTPDAVRLHAAMRDFADRGFVACAIEASSIGIVQHRLEALAIAVAVFTNLTPDHLDVHGTMSAYYEAKRTLFDWPGLRAAVVNVDDEAGARLAAQLGEAGAIELWTVSMQGPARLMASRVHHAGDALVFEVREGDAAATVHAPVVGAYNVSNLLGVLGALRALGVPVAEAAAALAAVRAVPGRLERIDAGGAQGGHAEGPALVVDYAHTPDALDKALQALRPLARARGGALWCVFGCGGDRDPTKRPRMGAIASRGADRIVITSDNPRSEPPAAILAQIAAGVTRTGVVEVIEDRAAAIAHAVAAAAAADVVLVAGKGHEDYQEIAGVKRPFSDAAQARAALQRRGASGGRA